MKRFLTFVLLCGVCGLFVFGTGSCTRKYTCKCIMTYTGAPGLPDTTVRSYTIQNTRQKADDLCKGHSGVYKEGSIVTTEDCNLW